MCFWGGCADVVRTGAQSVPAFLCLVRLPAGLEIPRVLAQTYPNNAPELCFARCRQCEREEAESMMEVEDKASALSRRSRDAKS